jgi:hypothetical protein
MSYVSIDRLQLIIESKFKGAAQLNQVDAAMAEIKKSTEKATKATKQMDMAQLSLGFALLFTGMAIKQYADRAIKELTTGYMKIADEQHAGTKKILEMEAATSFLKFTLMDMFVQSEFFAQLVEWFTELAIKIVEFAEQHPEIVDMLGAFVIFASVAGTIMMAFGQLAMFSFGIGASAGKVALVATALIAVASLSWTAFQKTPEAWNSVVNSVKTLETPLKNLLDTFKNFFNISGDGWETFAWLAVWAIDNVVNAFSLVANAASVIINALKTIYLAAVLAWSAIRGDTENKDAAFEALRTTSELGLASLTGMAVDMGRIINKMSTPLDQWIEQQKNLANAPDVVGQWALNNITLGGRMPLPTAPDTSKAPLAKNAPQPVTVSEDYWMMMEQTFNNSLSNWSIIPSSTNQ